MKSKGEAAPSASNHRIALHCIALHKSVNGIWNFLEINKIIQFHFNGRWTTSTISVGFVWLSRQFGIFSHKKSEWIGINALQWFMLMFTIGSIEEKEWKFGRKIYKYNVSQFCQFISSEIEFQSVLRHNWKLEGAATSRCPSKFWTFAVIKMGQFKTKKKLY